jgi:uncharacterized protein YecE (DUF72 family)
MAKWVIGCSGFYYKHWKNGFYPVDLPQKKWFAFYNEHFNTVELNVTFYRFPQLSFLQDWYDKTPADYKFSVKAPRGITHYKQFINCEQLLADFYGVIQEGLKEKLGCVLFQLPPRIKYKEEKLQQVIDALDQGFTNVVEFRHESWWTAEVYKRLAKNRISFCGQSHPLLPDEIVQNNKTLYYRFHGVPDLYRSPYETTTLHNFVDEVEANKKVKEAYVYFNNDIEVSAIKNALDMKSYVQQSKRKSR